MTFPAIPPLIVEVAGPDQVELGTQVELSWILAGGPPTAILVNGHQVIGPSYKATITADPTVFTVIAINAAGSAGATKVVGAHATGECASGHAQVYPPGVPNPQPASDVIRAGTVIAPPKKSNYVADLDGEKKWFARLEELKSAALQPGDLLFYKLYDDSNLIVRGQSIFTGASKGSKYSIHCQVYLGDGEVLSAEAQGVIANKVWPDTIAYRAKDKARALSAAEVAKFIVSKKVPYSTFHIFEEPIHDRSYGPVAKGRAEQIHRREIPVNAMMCSESVTYCFQDNPADPWILLDATRVGPIHVEDYVNSHPERFTFVGKVMDATGGATSSASETQQAVQAIKVEAVADAKADAKAVAAVATKAATATKKLGSKLKHLF